MEKIEINGHIFFLKVLFFPKKTSSAIIKDNCIQLRISSTIPSKLQEVHINYLKRRAIRLLKKNPEKFLKKREPFTTGRVIKTTKKIYYLKIEFSTMQNCRGKLDGNIIHIRINKNIGPTIRNKIIKKLIIKIISQDQLATIKKLIYELNSKYFGVKIDKVAVKKQDRLWGSCRGNNIYISHRLLNAPEDVLKYVCIHELCHLIEPNHSKKFWKLVRKIMPNYKEKINWLKQYRHTLEF
jgi:hypothetical protein